MFCLCGAIDHLHEWGCCKSGLSEWLFRQMMWIPVQKCCFVVARERERSRAVALKGNLVTLHPLCIFTSTHISSDNGQLLQRQLSLFAFVQQQRWYSLLTHKEIFSSFFFTVLNSAPTLVGFGFIDLNLGFNQHPTPPLDLVNVLTPRIRDSSSYSYYSVTEKPG